MTRGARRWVELLTARMTVRWLFLVAFVGSCVQLLLFVRWARGEGTYVPRPEAVAGLLPVGHFTSFFAWLRGGGWDTFLPAGLVIILGALTVSLLFKRGFCGWLCPLGTVWETAALLGRRVFGRDYRAPTWLDLAGRGLRYALTVAVFGFLAMVPLSEAVGFRELPYMWVADVKILDGLAHPLMLAMVGVAFAASMLLGPVWCRYLCPLGGLYSVLGSASPCTVTRDAETCIACGKCSAVCHAFVDVEHALTVRAPECDGCMECVRACPVESCLEPRAFERVRIAPWAWALMVVGLWLAIFGLAKVAGYWDTPIPPDTFRKVITSGLLEQRTPGGL